MSDKEDKKGDLFGLAAYGEVLNTFAKAGVDGVGAFLSRICLPAAEEFGLLLRDKISAWRAKNAINIAQKAEKNLIEFDKDGKLHAHPRLIMKIFLEGSWSDKDEVQEMWAGLLASSCTEDGKDESNILFINILSQITAAQATIINYSCKNCKKQVSEAGWIMAYPFSISLEDLKKITGLTDVHRIDRELDHLKSLELIGGGFHYASTTADITPTSISLQMYVRCQGFVGSPLEYFGIEEKRT